MKGLHKNSLRKGDNPHQWMIDDARMELIQQIKAEVERLKEENNNIRCDSNKAYCQGYGDAFADLLPILSDLEKEEKPINQDELEKAVVDYFEGYWPGMETAEQCNTDLRFTPPAIMRLARHFYELGRQSKPRIVFSKEVFDQYDREQFINAYKPKVCEGLEEEIERYLHSLGVGYGGWVDGMEDDDLRGIARHFAQWGAEHAKEELMKEAVEWLDDNAWEFAITKSKANYEEFVRYDSRGLLEAFKKAIIKEDEK